MPKSKKQKTHHNHQPYSTRNHHAQNNGNDALSHEEIWDDSALLRSWDDAVKEYEFYHSIHARGEDVDEVLRQAELAEQAEQEEARRQRLDQKTDRAKGQGEGGSGGTTATREAQMNGEHEESEEEGEIDEDEDHDVNTANDGNKIKTINIDTPEPIIPPSTQTSNPPTNPAQSTTDPSQPVSNQPLISNPTDKIMVDPNQQSTTGGPSPATEPDQTLENLKMAYYWAGYYSGLYDSQRSRQGGIGN